MKASWIIYDHHLALQDGKNVYHPNASDIYDLLSKDESEKKMIKVATIRQKTCLTSGFQK